jgi:hypothetical protein
MNIKLPIKILLFFLVQQTVQTLNGQIVPRKYLFNQTYTHQELIATYKALETKYTFGRLLTYGYTDGGNPIHLFVIDAHAEFSPVEAQKRGKRTLFILNGIHPGEPDGIDASVEFAEDLLKDKEYHNLLSNVTVIIMPVYNVDGMLIRGNTRVNQNGPEESGFRANARNLDLNRDCIKADSKNMEVLTKIFQDWKPEFFIDTHVSNGADYHYVMTLIPTAPDKLEEPQKIYLRNQLLPKLYENMRVSGFEMAPYVLLKKDIPDSGIVAFNDSPRYTTGYASLFGTIGFTTETHMLKPFPDRVKATKAFLTVLFKELSENYDKVFALKKQALFSIRNSEGFYLNHETDFSRLENLLFKGYEAEYKTSDLTGAKRLYYNRSRPFEKTIPYYAYLRGKNFVRKPEAYLIPQAWREIISRLKANGIDMEELETEKEFNAEYYIIEEFSGPYLYEGRAMVSPTKISSEKGKIIGKEGDYLVKTGTESDKFLLSVLEPLSKDSYFQWGFFNSILEQKEYFSDYLFEETALELIQKKPELKASMDEFFRKNSDLDTPGKRLEYIFKNSTYSDPFRGIYPIYRIMP